MLGNQVESNERNSLAGHRHHGIALNSRVNCYRVRQPCERSDDVIRHPADRSDFKIGIANQGFHGRAEGARGGITSQFNCQYDRNTKCNRDHDKRSSQRVAVEGTND